MEHLEHAISRLFLLLLSKVTWFLLFSTLCLKK